MTAGPHPLGLLVSQPVWQLHGPRLSDIARRHGRRLVPVFPGDQGAAVSAEIAFFSRDLYQGSTLATPGPASSAFFGTAMAAPRLQWLQVCSSGIDLPDYGALLAMASPVPQVTTAAGSTARPIALNVLAAILALQRGFAHWLTAQREHRWAPHARNALPRDLAGQHAVIIGTGAIGSAVSRLLRANGMRVTGIRRSAETHPDFDALANTAGLDALLPGCDWLVLACPLTQETRGMIDANRLALLPPEAGLVNVGRGGLVDETALIAALRTGRPAHAYLDVFATEPLRRDSPLWDMPNVWITPHNASACAGHDARVVDIFAENLDAWMSDKPLRNLVAAAGFL